ELVDPVRFARARARVKAVEVLLRTRVRVDLLAHRRQLAHLCGVTSAGARGYARRTGGRARRCPPAACSTSLRTLAPLRRGGAPVAPPVGRRRHLRSHRLSAGVGIYARTACRSASASIVQATVRDRAGRLPASGWKERMTDIEAHITGTVWKIEC